MAKAGAYPVTFDSVSQRERHYIVCTGCGTTEYTSKGGRVALPVAGAVKRFHEKGWDASVKHLGTGICPACRKKPRLVYTEPTEEPAPMTKHLAPASIAVTPQEIRAAKADAPKQPDMDAVLLILDAVETNYDPKTGYTGGCSDQQIANSLTCPVDWVRQVRTKKFGALPEKPEVAEIRQEIDALKTKCEQAIAAFHKDEDEMDRELSEMEKRRLDRFNHNKARIDSLVQSLAKLRERLEKLHA